MTIHELFSMQRSAHIAEGPATVEERVGMLERLYDAILHWEDRIAQALDADLGKSPTEAYMTETGIVLQEISCAISHVRRWAKTRIVPSSLFHFISSGRVLKEPLGVVLIVSPWNFPFLMALCPFVSAIAAGCSCVIMPDGYAPKTAALLSELLSECFPAEMAAVVLGGQSEYFALLDEPFDAIYFSGSAAAGKTVLEKAARFMTPVFLNLNGKSPCIVDDSADLILAARRIAFGKALNAGQSRIAPDYLLVQENVKDRLLSQIQNCFSQFYGDPLTSAQWPRIVSPRHYERLLRLMQGEHIFCGGRDDGQHIEPTILDFVSWDSPVMQEDIMGPILPVVTFRDVEDIIPRIIRLGKPPALYLFTRRNAVRDQIMERIPFGSGCVNDTVIQAAVRDLPIGGSNRSALHGQAGFDLFTHEKSIMVSRSWPDLKARYAPYSQQKLKRLKKRLK